MNFMRPITSTLSSQNMVQTGKQSRADATQISAAETLNAGLETNLRSQWPFNVKSKFSQWRPWHLNRQWLEVSVGLSLTAWCVSLGLQKNTRWTQSLTCNVDVLNIWKCRCDSHVCQWHHFSALDPTIKRAGWNGIARQPKRQTVSTSELPTLTHQW